MSVVTLPALKHVDAASWDHLLGEPYPFLRHAFLSSLEDSGSLDPGSGWQAAHQLLLDADRKPLAAMPAYVKLHSSGEYVFDHGWADACRRAGLAYYPKLLGAVPFSPVSGPRLLGAPRAALRLLGEVAAGLEEQGLSGLHINFTDAPANRLLAQCPGWLARLGCQYHWHNPGYRDFQDFLDRLSSRKRKQMRKEREQVAGQGIGFDWLEGRQLSEAQWDFVYQCYANTYRVRGRPPYLTRSFFSLLAERMPEAIRVVLAHRGAKPLAMAFSLVAGDSLYGRYWGCLAEFDRLHFETCFYQGMEWSIRHRIHRFDAGAQGEHKLIRGFEPVLTHSWHYLRHAGLREAVADFLREERAALLAYVEQARSLLPYRQEG
jgi:predicted N-acyltransferase